MEHTVEIKRAVLHVLDENSVMPVLSKGELEVLEDLAIFHWIMPATRIR